MNFEIVKISAAGYNLAFMTIKVNDFYQCIRIPRKLYTYLKGCGVPTAQSLRGKQNESKTPN